MDNPKEELKYSQEDLDNIVNNKLLEQLYEHVKMLSEKLDLSEEEAGKLLDVSPEELLPLRFNAFMMDAIETTTKEVVEKYIEEHGLKKPADDFMNPPES